MRGSRDDPAPRRLCGGVGAASGTRGHGPSRSIGMRARDPDARARRHWPRHGLGRASLPAAAQAAQARGPLAARRRPAHEGGRGCSTQVRAGALPAARPDQARTVAFRRRGPPRRASPSQARGRGHCTCGRGALWQSGTSAGGTIAWLLRAQRCVLKPGSMRTAPTVHGSRSHTFSSR